MTRLRVPMALILGLVAIASGVVMTWLSHDAPAVEAPVDEPPRDDTSLSPTAVTPFRAAIEAKAAVVPATDATDLLDWTVTKSAEESAQVIAYAETGTASLSVRASSTSGTPVGGVWVTVLQAGPGEMSEDLLLRMGKYRVKVRTGADGLALVYGLAEWLTYLCCDAPPKGFAPPESLVVVPSGQEIAFVLRPTDRVSGVVVGPDGAPMEGILVGPLDGSGRQGSRSHATGRFSIELPLGETFDLGVVGEERVSNHGSDFTMIWPFASHYRGCLRGVCAPATNLVLRLEAVPSDRAIQVVVRDADGLPAAHVDVRLRLLTFDTSSATTDIEGRASFTGLPDEDLVIWASPHDASDSPWVAARPVTVTPNGQSIELRLRRATTIAGIVLDPDGTPVWGDIVSVSAPKEEGAAVVTDASGRFRFKVASGTGYQLSVEHIADRKLSTTLSEVAADGAEVVVRLGQR